MSIIQTYAYKIIKTKFNLSMTNEVLLNSNNPLFVYRVCPL